MDDSDLALEQAVQRLDCESESSDSEVDGGHDREGKDADTSSTESSRLTREVIECMYSNSTAAPSNQMEQEEEGSTISNLSTSSAPHRQQSPLPSDLGGPLNAIFSNVEAFSTFRRFLQDQCITRNLNFWLACQSFRDMVTKTTDLKEVANAIYVKFIKLSAPQHITLTKDTKRDIKMALTMNKTPITYTLFDSAQKEIGEIMAKNELRQFLVSDMSSECGVELGSSELYTPSMANPAYGVCGGGSLRQSGSEDSSSVTSFSTE